MYNIDLEKLKKTVNLKNIAININIKHIFIILSLMFVFPSIVYILSGKDIANLVSSFTFFFNKPTLRMNIEKLIGTLCFAGIFIGIAISYFIILKKHKELFKNNKQIAKFIIIVSVIFSIILPLTSTDVFYHISVGWSEAHYKVNPYNTSVADVVKENQNNDDEILAKMPNIWKDSKTVYGRIMVTNM